MEKEVVRKGLYGEGGEEGVETVELRYIQG